MESRVLLEDCGNGYKVYAVPDSAGNYTNTEYVYELYEGIDYSVGTKNGYDMIEYHVINKPSNESFSDNNSSTSQTSSYPSNSNAYSCSYGGSGINWKKVLIFSALMISVTVVENIALAFTAFFNLGEIAVPAIITIIVSVAAMIWSIFRSRKKYWHKKRYIFLTVIACLAIAFGVYLLLCSLDILNIDMLLNLLRKH